MGTHSVCGMNEPVILSPPSTGAGRAGRQVKFAEYLSHARHQARDFLIYAPPFFSFVSQVLPSENISISFIPEVDMEASPREAQ